MSDALLVSTRKGLFDVTRNGKGWEIAAGHFLGEKGHGRVVVGMDTRRSGDMLEASLVAGICSSGVDALRTGIVPTPAVAFLARDLKADGGVVISASHNPAEYNGMKMAQAGAVKVPRKTTPNQ